MKKTFFLFTSIIFTLLFSCTQGRESKNSVQSDSNNDIDSTLLSSNSPELEDFAEFVEKFSKEKSFQMQRIKFPIKVIVPDSEHEGMAPMEDAINKYDWEQLDLTYDSTYLTRPYDQYYQVVRFDNDTAIVEIRGIDNGIYADYYFTIIDRKWYLVTLYEASF